MIQARHISFNIEYGRYIKPLEEHFISRSSHSHNFGKGNYDQLGAKVMKFLPKYKYITEVDHSTFDAYVTVEHLKLTHKYYQACYHHSKELRNLSAQTIKNHCKTRKGDKYNIKGTRMSGDVDTSFGNSLINYAAIKFVLEKLNIKGDAMVNGDDSLIFTNEKIPVEKAKELFALVNLESKIQHSVERIEDAEFCRGKFVINNMGRLTFMVDPERLIDIFGMTYKSVNSYQKYIMEVLTAYVIINQNTSVSHYFKKLFKCCFKRDVDTNTNFKYLDDALMRAVNKQRECEIDLECVINNSMVRAFTCFQTNYFELHLRHLAYSIQHVLAMDNLTTQHLIESKTYDYILTIDHDQQVLRVDEVCNLD